MRALLAGLLLVSACGDNCDVDETYTPTINPASFSTTIDNPLFPWIPGTTFVYAEGPNTVTVTVTSQTKVIMGVTCVEVHDAVTQTAGGALVEDTLDWYAQDNTGNVWYFGEDTKEYENGEVVSTEGSWEAGVDGAQPGVVMPDAPFVGQEYRQEYYACHAEDKAEVLALNATVTVPFGTFSNCVKTHDFTPLDPEVNEEKTYCPGAGIVLAVDVNTGEREELLSKTP